MSKRLHHQRIEFRDAAAFVSAHHRHHTPPVGHLFSIGAYEGARLCGVVIVGRPVVAKKATNWADFVTRLNGLNGERHGK